MGTRRKSRELALQALYQLDVTKQDPSQVLAQFQKHFSSQEEKDEFLEKLVLGVLGHLQEIDRLIERFSENWRLSRMSLIDRNILRMAVFELLHCNDIPPKVVLNEAIEIGKEYGSEDSGSFINGILDRIQKEGAKINSQ